MPDIAWKIWHPTLASQELSARLRRRQWRPFGVAMSTPLLLFGWLVLALMRSHR